MQLKQFRTRNYLAKDFDSLRAQLINYARLYYPDRIQDFSENSLGGLLIDLAAYTGDVMSFYLDHQYNELDSELAVETRNIERMIKSAGVKINGASPATVEITIYVEVPAKFVSNEIKPAPESIPIIKAGSIFTSTNGVSFNLLSDIDFSIKKSDGVNFVADVKVGKKTSNGTPITFTMAMTGICVSGQEITETFSFGNFTPFKPITLSQNNITDILSVSDSRGNVYYQVNSLVDDVVYRNVLNLSRDSQEISDSLKVVPAPYRFIENVDLANRSTTLIFGGGDDSSIEDDVVPDPSDFAISFPYSKTFSRVSINPLQMLKTRTLGVYSANSELTVTYRYGGGLNHNVPPGGINSISLLNIDFPLNPGLNIINEVRRSIAVTNKVQATGGENSPTIDELRALIPSFRNSQERIVTREDLLARVYSIPSNFGRVFRAAIRPNPNNPLVTQLHIISRTSSSELVHSSDTLKENLRKYLAPYRMITDAIEILDAQIINLGINFDVTVDPSLNGNIVLQNILKVLKEKFDTKKSSIDQPIVITNILSTIYSVPGVLSVIKLEFKNLSGLVNNVEYSPILFDVNANIRKGILFPPEGGIFEIKYPDIDILGRTSL